MTERLSNKNPCNDCKVDRQIGNPNRWECECDRCDKPNDWKSECVKKLSEYETAEEEGRLVVLPCKVGQDLFGIYNRTIIDGYADGYLLEKTSVHSDADHWIWLQDKNSKNYWKVSFDEIGKTVFLTREEAEKALKEMEGKHE